MMTINIDALPPEIRDSRRAVLWKYEKDSQGKPTKVPYQAHAPAHHASVSDPNTWNSFDIAYQRYLEGDADGVGIVSGDGLVGLDLDHCRDPQTGVIAAWAQEIVRAMDSYTEITPSACGLRIWLKGVLPPSGRKRGNIEMYDGAHYLTVTGEHLQQTPSSIEERAAQLAAVHARVFGGNGRDHPQAWPHDVPRLAIDDVELLDQARRAKNGEKFTRLWACDITGYDSPSNADLALCDLLAFWTGRDATRMDRLFRQSGLMRDKWDERRGAQTYGEKTIAEAVHLCRETYSVHDHVHDHEHDLRKPEDPTPAVEHLTDLGDARRLVALHGRDLRYCFGWKAWLTWTGQHWPRDDSGEAARRAKDVVRAIYLEASRCADEEQRKALAKHALHCEGDRKLRAILASAESERELVARPDAFDRDPWLFNCQNGTVDLHGGGVREHRREDLLTKCCPVDYDLTAVCPTWDAFLNRIMGGNAALVAFLQRAVGYTLTGCTEEQVWFLLYGTGANGKTTFLRTVTDLLGEYAVWTPAQTLLAKRGEAIQNDLASLRGARMVGAIEAEGGRRLAEALVKQLTGGDPVTARFLYSEYFTFIPTFKLWFGSNHKPQIRGTDHAVWRRIRLIPFTVTIPEPEQDKQLGEKLQAEFPGILAWALRGCLDWQQHSLETPDMVRQATAAYRESQDIIANFLADRCEVDPGAVEGATDLYEAYKLWCEKNREPIETQRAFGDSLTERGFDVDRHRTTKRKVRFGLRLTEQTEHSDLLFGKV